MNGTDKFVYDDSFEQIVENKEKLCDDLESVKDNLCMLRGYISNYWKGDAGDSAEVFTGLIVQYLLAVSHPCDNMRDKFYEYKQNMDRFEENSQAKVILDGIEG